MTMMVIYECQSMMITVFNLCPEVFAAILELDQFLKEEEEERREKEEKVRWLICNVEKTTYVLF